MKSLHARVGTLLGTILVLTLSAQTNTAPREQPTVVVGTFDSRAVAVAYVQSQAFEDYVNAQRADVERMLDRAKVAGDDELVEQLNALGPAMQARLHQQGFGTAPVDDILARISDELPKIATAAGVDVIVSKWSLNYRSPGAKFVDVTGLIAAEFDPDERTLTMIRSTMKTDPLPRNEISHDH